MGYDPRSLTKEGFSIFHTAAISNQGEFLQSLLSGADAARVNGFVLFLFSLSFFLPSFLPSNFYI